MKDANQLAIDGELPETPEGEPYDPQIDPPANDAVPPSGWARIAVADMMKPLPPIPWVVRELELAPGAPTMFAGYGFSSKTMACQALAVAVAGNAPVWGAWTPGRTGPVVHIDHEQGRHLSISRYQRLIRAQGVDIPPENLSLVVMPPNYLDSPGAEEIYMRELDGHVLAIVDSLRAAAPSADENDSDVRRSLDLLGRVSDRTGCACIVIHHARKPKADSMGGAKMEIRGSGALFDACQSVLVLSAEKGQPTRLEHEKARISGELQPARALEVIDVEGSGDPRWGLAVTVAGADEQAQARGRAELDGLCSTVLDVVRANPGSSGRAVQRFARTAGWKGRPGDISVALEVLERGGAVTMKPGARRTQEWFATGPGGTGHWVAQ